jgi:hypothetical protein
MILPRLTQALAIGLAVLPALAVPAAGAAKERTCFYYANSGWGLWATRNVSCKTAKKVYNDATKRIPAGAFDQTIRVDGYRCKMNFDGGGAGTCTASRQRRIRFEVP